jgi:putative polyhydroxyalkanoate system protein
MSSIDISRDHSLTLAQAKKAASKVAKEMADAFAIEHDWDGNTLNFRRAGVEGAILLSKGHVRVHAKLSWLLSALRGKVESEVNRYLDQEFGGKR